MTTSLIVECGRLCMQKLISVDVLKNSIALNVQAHSKIPLSPRARIWKLAMFILSHIDILNANGLTPPQPPPKWIKMFW